MPSIRSGFGSDFVLKSEKIGIGSTTPTSVFDVAGAIKGDFAVTGVATLTSYGGFVAQNQHINKASSIGFATVGLQTGLGIVTTVQYYETETGFTNLGGVHHGDDQYFNTLSEDLIVEDGQILNITNTEMVGVTPIGEYDPHTHSSYVCAGSLEQVSVTDHFSVPNGGINDRQETPIEGTVRFNTDLNTLEFFNGVEWRQFTYNQGQSGRAVFAGGYTPTSGAAGDFASVIDYVNISTRGNAVNFGEMHAGTYAALFGFSSSTRGLFGGGYKNATTAPNITNDVAYITIASEGNTIDFGNLNSAQNWGKSAHASSTRGLAMGGYSSVTDIDYVEIATLGNFLDFGDLIATEFGGAGMGSPTVALSVGSGPNGYVNQVTIASKGNAIKWGETDANPEYYAGGGSNSVRGLFNKTRSKTTQVQSLIIASSGTIENFGNLTSTNGVSSNYMGGNGNCASQTTLLFAGGGNNTAAVNTIETISITTSGNATDFGDLTTKRGYMGACSDSHGGLGGF